MISCSPSRCAFSRTKSARSQHTNKHIVRYAASPAAAAPRHLHGRAGVVVPVATRASTPPRAADATTVAVVEQLVDEMRLLETERDDAIKTAESCARTCVKLEEMVELLDRVAMERVRGGDDAAARAALAEKQEAREALERASGRAAANYALAAKLAEKVGAAQRRLMDAMGGGGSSGGGNAGSSSSGASAAEAVDGAEAPAAAAAEASGRVPDGTSGAAATTSSTGAAAEPPLVATPASPPPRPPPPPPPPPRRMPWEDSLDAARARIREADAAAAAAAADARASGARAAFTARETVDEARARLRADAAASVAAARARVAASAGESIAEARARIAREDELALEKVRALMARYRRGEYVSESELEWAFRELERRFPR